MATTQSEDFDPVLPGPGEVVGTPGTPVELLGGSIKQEFFPKLWDVRDRLTRRAIDEERR